jgi:hypothetical protein
MSILGPQSADQEVKQNQIITTSFKKQLESMTNFARESECIISKEINTNDVTVGIKYQVSTLY